MDIDQIISSQLPFFKEETLRNEISEKAQLVEVSAGTPILKEGAYVKTIPILLKGLVKVVKEEAGGKELLLYYIYPLESCIVSINCGIHDLKKQSEGHCRRGLNCLTHPVFANRPMATRASLLQSFYSRPISKAL